MVERQAVTLISNWNILGDIPLECILMDNSSDDKEIEIENIQITNCVCLINSDKNEHSKAHLEIRVPGCLTDILLVSEAQIIEVFGVNGEYLSTCTAEFIDDYGDMAVYYSKISVPNIPTCTLNFTRTKTPNRVWLYGAKVLHKTQSNQSRSPVLFNLEQINRLIEHSNFSNLKNLNSLEELLRFYFKRVSSSNLVNILEKKTNGEKSSHVHEENNQGSLTEMLSKLYVNIPSSNDSKTLTSEQNLNETHCKDNDWLISYIDKKCHEIKNDILHEVYQKLDCISKETNQKLDNIISILENRKLTEK